MPALHWRKYILVFSLLGLVIALAACSEESQTNPSPKPETINAFKAEPATNNGNPAKGQTVFMTMPCLTCHTLKGAGGTEGHAPPLDKIGIDAGTRLEGVNAVQYIRHALLKPEDVRLPEYRNIMPSFSNSLSSQQLDDLVAYLLTLKGS